VHANALSGQPLSIDGRSFDVALTAPAVKKTIVRQAVTRMPIMRGQPFRK